MAAVLAPSDFQMNDEYKELHALMSTPLADTSADDELAQMLAELEQCAELPS